MNCRKNGRTSNRLTWLVLSAAITANTAWAQSCNDAMGVSNLTEQYVTNRQDGTVRDVINGITWQICSVGQTYNPDENQCDGTPAHFETWQDALNTSSADFILPNIKQLDTLVERSCIEPAIITTAFPGTPESALYWTNTPDMNARELVGRFIDFTDGSESLRDTNKARHVRLIRVE